MVTGCFSLVSIMACLKKDRALLEVLIHATPRERKALLKVCDTSRIRTLCECAYNVLRGNVPLSNIRNQQLRKHKATLRKIVKRGERWSTKRKYLVQQGGGFLIPLLLSTVLQAVMNKALPNES